MRAVLRSDAAALVHRGLIDPARLSSCDGQPGYKTIATELGVLASVMTSCWPQIQGKSCVTEQELHRAEAIAEALLAFVGLREQPPEKRAAAIDIRDRAFTLLVDNYDVARRAITFLRWNDGDADLVAPSLYGGKRRASTKADDQEEEVSSTANPATTPGASAVTMPAATPTATPAPGNGSANTSSAGVSVGRPNSNPFVQ